MLSPWKLALLVILILVLAPVRSQQSPKGPGEIRRLLDEMNGNHSTKQLAVLFQIGDDRIDELISALGDPDENIRLSAQIVIRYLGNERGMNSWKRMYRTDESGSLIAPFPIPLNNVDVSFIRSQYLRDNVQTEWLMDACLFALALDGSSHATQLLKDVFAYIKKHGLKIDQDRYLQVRHVSIGAKTNLAQQVLERAPFLHAADRRYTAARVVAYTAVGDKALVEIHVNRGPLAQECYHVVLKRTGQDWTFFSITLVTIS